MGRCMHVDCIVVEVGIRIILCGNGSLNLVNYDDVCLCAFA